MLNVSLLGGSNSLKKSGLRKSLSKNSNFKNYALGASTSIQNLYEIIRNKKEIKKSDLVISESNVNDFHNINELRYDFSIAKRNIELLYSELAKLECCVLILLLPLQTKKYSYSEEVNYIHRKCIDKYGFNCIDMDMFYKENFLSDFYYFDNLDHPLDYIMKRLGEQIIDRFDLLKKHNSVNLYLDEFLIVDEFRNEKRLKENSMFCEYLTDIKESIQLDANYKGYNIIGLHSWSDESSIITLKNEDFEVSRYVNNECQFHEFHNDFLVTDWTWVLPNSENQNFEKSIRTDNVKYPNHDNYPSIIGILLYKNSIRLKEDECSDAGANDITFLLLEYLTELKIFIEDFNRIKKSMLFHRRMLFKYRDKFLVSFFIYVYKRIRK